MFLVIIKMYSFLPVAKVTPVSPANHGETLSNDLKNKDIHFLH